jgi:hypothetical protein
MLLAWVIDIEGSEKIKSSPAYEQWARIKNLKISGQTLIHLKKLGVDSIDEFDLRYQSAMSNFSAANKVLSVTDSRIKALEDLQKYLRNYGRTKDSYKKFKSARDPDKFLRQNRELESDIIIHEAARRFFDRYIAEHGKPLPKSSAVKEELASLKSLKAKQSAEYQTAKAERDTMLKLKVNVQSILGKDSVREYKAEVSISKFGSEGGIDIIHQYRLIVKKKSYFIRKK